METKRVCALRNGDYQAFSEVFDCFWDKVYSYLAQKTKNTEAAKDLTQLVFIKLWKYRHTLTEDVSLNEQIFRKTKQIFIDWLRQELRKRKYLVEKENLTELYVPVQEHENIGLRNDVLKALRTLPPKRKEIFELRHIYGYSYKEIAKLLGISVKTVDNQLLKANQQLRKMLQLSVFAAISSDILIHQLN
ncbi:MAG TPA: RNA polymerase sigma factor [Niabella sp.]